MWVERLDFVGLNDEFEYFGALKYSDSWGSFFTWEHWNFLKSHGNRCIKK